MLQTVGMFDAACVLTQRHPIDGIGENEALDMARAEAAIDFETGLLAPMLKPTLVSFFLFSFVYHWNDYFWPFLVGRDENIRVLTVALGIFRSQTPQGVPDWTGLTAATLLSIIPIFLLLIFLGRRIVDSIAFSGLK